MDVNREENKGFASILFYSVLFYIVLFHSYAFHNAESGQVCRPKSLHCSGSFPVHETVVYP